MTYTSITKPASGATASKANFADLVCDNFDDHEARIASAETGKVPTSRLVSTGTGLTGGGDLTADRTLSVQFGTTSNTVTRGDDSRVTITQDATQGNAALHTRVSAIETVRDTRSRRYTTGTATIVSNTTTATLYPFDTVEDATNIPDTAITYSAGTFTATNAGEYDIFANLTGTIGAGTGYYWDAFIAPSSSGNKWGSTRIGIGAGSVVCRLPVFAKGVFIAAGGTFGVFLQCSAAAATNTWANQGATLHETNIAIRRVR